MTTPTPQPGTVSLRIPGELLEGDLTALDALDRITAETRLSDDELAAARVAAGVDSSVGKAPSR